MNKSFKIKDIFEDHLDSFLREGYSVRPAVLENVEKVINIGVQGFF